MLKRITTTIVAAMLLALSFGAAADPVTMVFSCELKDGKTKEEAMAVNAKWLKWARATAGTDEITSSYVTTVVGDFGGFMWVDTYPSASAWAKTADADSEFEEEFDALATCSSNRMYRGEETVPAK
jgi:hypothetical protein